MTSRLKSKRLYIAHLAQQLASMESGELRLQPLLYRLLARRLREAAAGIPEPALVEQFGPQDAQVDEMLETRHFESHGSLRGRRASAVRLMADQLLARVRIA
jgi:hypothetical protein